jgi:hypothetical protein
MTTPHSIAFSGAIAQLVERVLCKHEVVGSIPSGSTIIEASRDRKQQTSFRPGLTAGVGKMTS